MRFKPDADFPEIVKTVPHLAFEVDELNGNKVIIEPDSPSPGVWTAFIEIDVAPIDLTETNRSISAEGIKPFCIHICDRIIAAGA